MNLTEPDVPEEDRTDSQSSLDFMYWMIQFVDIAYPREIIIPSNKGEEADGEAMMQAVMYCSTQVGLSLITPNYELFRKRCEETALTQEQAFAKRGAVLFFGKSLAVSMGDKKRIIEYVDDIYVARYLTPKEREPEHWIGALVPEMIYL